MKIVLQQSSKDRLCLLCETILVIIAFIFRSYDLVAWLSFAQFVLISINFITNSKKKILVGFVFMIFAYLFHFGQAIIHIFDFYDKYQHLNVISKTSEQEVITASLFAMLCFLFIHVGYFIKSSKSLHNKVITVDDEERVNSTYLSDLTAVRKIALFIFFISVIPMLYIDISKLLALRTAGYLSTYLVYREGIGKYLNLIGRFCKPIVPVLIYAYSADKRKSRGIAILFGLYLIVMMLSGDRGTSMIYLVTIVLVYFNYVETFKLRYLILGAIVIYFLLTLLTTISLFRDQAISMDTFVSSIDRRNEDGIVYSTLREFGGTMISLVYSMRYFPAYSGFNYGLTYLFSFFNISPVLPSFALSLLEPSFSFVNRFPLNVQTALGGSVFGEAYHNFGWVAPIFCVFIGMILSRIDSQVNNHSNSRFNAFMIVLVPNILLWTRDYFSSMVFNCFWLALAFKFLKVRKN